MANQGTKLSLKFFRYSFVALCFVVTALGNYAATAATVTQIIIPQGQDRFLPFGATVHAGGSVKWINQDGEEHIIKSDDFFTTTKERRIDHFVVGTGANNGQPGEYTLKFTKPGLFVYYCSIHAKLDSKHQPVSKMVGNNAPMMGVIAVVP